MPASGQTDTDTNSTSPQLTDAAIKMLDAHARQSRFFLWVHYFDPHAQYVPHEGAPDFTDPAKPAGWKMRAAYDGEVWFTDQAIGRLLDYIQAQPWGKDTIVALTSDHGEAMNEHGHRLSARLRDLGAAHARAAHPVRPRRGGAAGPREAKRHRSRADAPRPDADPAAGAGRALGPEHDGRHDARRRPDPYEERDVYLDMPDGPYTHMRRALLHGTTPGMKLIHFGGRQYQLYDLARGPRRDDRSRRRSRASSAPMVDLMQAKRATLSEIYVKPDTPMLP